MYLKNMFGVNIDLVNSLCLLLGFIICRLQASNRCTVNDKNTSANCSYRNLSYIPVEMLPKTLKYLDLSGNVINVIESGIFRKFCHLEILHIDDNKITLLKPNCFEGLEHLKQFSMKNHGLKLDRATFSEDIFKPFHNLEVLYLARNMKKENIPFDVHYYPDDAFRNLSKLQSLSIVLYPKPKFGDGFRNMVALEKIDFDNCFLSQLENRTFQNLSSNLKEIHMKHCTDISTVVGAAAFEHFKHLKVLDLTATYISLPSALLLLYGLQRNKMDVINFYQVNPNLLAGKINPYTVVLTSDNTRYLHRMCVKYLNLAANEIVEVRQMSIFSFHRPECLEHFILSQNRFDLLFQLHGIDLIIFIHRAVNLETADMSYIAVDFPEYIYPYTPSNVESLKQPKTQIQSDSFHHHLFRGNDYPLGCPPKFHTLRLSHILMYLYAISNFTALGCENFKVLDISYSSWRDLNFQVQGFENLSIVNASGVDISKTFPTVINSLTYLKTLIIREVNLDRAFEQPTKDRLLSGLRHLETIDMSKNHLKTIPASALRKIYKLQHINLSTNSLDQFPLALLDHPYLQYIDLTENKLTGLNKTVLSWLNGRTNIHQSITLLLSRNVFSCNCENMDFIKWLFTTNVVLDNGGNFTCVLQEGKISNTAYANKHFKEMFIDCQSKFWLAFSVVFSCLLCLVMITTVVCFRFRWRLSYFFHRLFRHEYEEIDANTYTYEAFVAYHADDYQWVWWEMRVKLEDQYGFKLCLHDREFVPGENITQNIHNFMQDSRKIIFDITPGFISGKWLEYEIEMAKMDMLQRRNNKGIIVILRNGVQPEEMPRIISNIWHNITCLTWPGNTEDIIDRGEAEELFWRRLVDILK